MGKIGDYGGGMIEDTLAGLRHDRRDAEVWSQTAKTAQAREFWARRAKALTLRITVMERNMKGGEK